MSYEINKSQMVMIYTTIIAGIVLIGLITLTTWAKVVYCQEYGAIIVFPIEKQEPQFETMEDIKAYTDSVWNELNNMGYYNSDPVNMTEVMSLVDIKYP